MKQKTFDWKKHQLSITKSQAKRIKLELSELELLEVQWAATLPDFVSGGAGERRDGLTANTPRPDVADVAFDEGNRLAVAYWDAYIREPELVLTMILNLRRKRRRDAEKPPLTMDVKEVAYTMRNETVELQLRKVLEIRGNDPKDKHFTKALDSARTTRKRLIKSSS